MTNVHLHRTRRSVLASAAGIAAALALPSSWSQPRWPDKPVRLVVGFPAGSSPDMLARLLADPLQAKFGQPFIVENRAGASGTIGAAMLAKAKDSHTFGVVGVATLTSAPAIYHDLNFKPSDFAPITVIGSSPQMLITSAKIEYSTVSEFLTQARQAGKHWSYGSLGVGSLSHLSMELLKEKTGISAVHVPYNSAPAVLTAIASGDLQLALLPIGNALAQVQAGRVRAVALTSSVPSPLAPDVPALAQAGVKDVVIDVWNAVMAPASTPPSVIAAFGAAVRQILRTEDLRQKLLTQGWIADGGSAEELQKRIADDSARWHGVVARLGSRIEK